MRLFIKLTIAIALVFWASAAHADFEAAKQAYERGDYPTARNELAAIKSDPRAAFELAKMIEAGLGGPKDLFAAAELYKVAARAGHPLAILRLGLMYEHGQGVSVNAAFAQELYGTLALQTPNPDNNPIVQRAIVAAKNNLAYLWARQNGLLEEALCLSAQTMAFDPDNNAYKDTYGFVLMRLGRLREAETYFKKAIEGKTSSAGLEHMGDVAFLRGDRTAALDWWTRALPSAPHPRDNARLQQKISGQKVDLDSFPQFELKSGPLGKDCPTS